MKNSRMNPIEHIFRVFDEGSNSILLTGRSLYDLDFNETTGKIQPLMEILKERALCDHNLLVIRYTLATGVEIDLEPFTNVCRQIIVRYLEEKTIIRSGRIAPANENEFQGIIRSIYKLIGKDDNHVVLPDSRVLRFLFLFEFAQHRIPGGLSCGDYSNDGMITRELCYLLSNSLSLRKSGHFMIFNSVGEEETDKLITNELVSVRLPYPSIEEKVRFIKTLQERYPDASLEENLSVEMAANLTSNTPNKSLEKIFLGSNNTRITITPEMLYRQKQEDTKSLSEETLTLLDTERVKNVTLAGRNIRPALEYLKRCSEWVRSGNPFAPKNILIVGAPASGKTDLALLTAVMTSMPVYQINSPKAGIVGATEQRARLQMMLLKAMNPNLGFIDEVTEAFPMSRNDHNLDSGASAAVTGQLLNALSDKSRAGKSIIIATTNCPWKIGTAMLSRFICIPVLMPLQEDFGAIVSSVLISLTGGTVYPVTDEDILNAATIFWNKGATPRTILSSLSNALGMYGKLDGKALIFAAQDVCPQDHRDKLGAIFSDLWAIKVTASQSLLPWNNDQNYPFPEYIREVVDSDGYVISSKLDKAIEQLEPFVNV